MPDKGKTPPTSKPSFQETARDPYKGVPANMRGKLESIDKQTEAAKATHLKDANKNRDKWTADKFTELKAKQGNSPEHTPKGFDRDASIKAKAKGQVSARIEKEQKQFDTDGMSQKQELAKKHGFDLPKDHSRDKDHAK